MIAAMAGGLACSVVVINHNYGRFLDQSVQSALAQLSGRVEVVVVDDASTDDSRRRIAELPGAVVRVLLDVSGGHVRALNAGFAASSGDVVVFLDADDWLEPNCLDVVLAAWQPDVSKVQFRLTTVDRDGVDQGMPFPFFSASLDSDEVLRRSLATGYYPWSVSSGNAYGRRYLEQVLPIPAERIFKSPDGYLNKMAPLFGRVVSLPRAMANYRVHGSNAWAQARDNVNLASLTRAVRFDAVLHGAFVEAAAASGYSVVPYADLPVPQLVEYRLLSLRLAPADHPIARDSRTGLTMLGVRAAFVAPDISRMGRLLWVAWFLLLGIAPAGVVAKLFLRGRGQTSRSKLFRYLIHFAKGSRAVARSK